jgi:hypothetical protein
MRPQIREVDRDLRDKKAIDGQYDPRLVRAAVVAEEESLGHSQDLRVDAGMCGRQLNSLPKDGGNSRAVRSQNSLALLGHPVTQRRNHRNKDLLSPRYPQQSPAASQQPPRPNSEAPVDISDLGTNAINVI